MGLDLSVYQVGQINLLDLIRPYGRSWDLKNSEAALTLCCGAAAAVLPQDGPGRQAGAAAHSAQPNPVLLLVNKKAILLYTELYSEQCIETHESLAISQVAIVISSVIGELEEWSTVQNMNP